MKQVHILAVQKSVKIRDKAPLSSYDSYQALQCKILYLG